MEDDTIRRPTITMKALLLYFALSFAITWSILIPGLRATGGKMAPIVIIPAAFGPFIAAILATWVGEGRQALGQWLRRTFRLRIPLWLYLTGAFAMPLAMGLLHYGLHWLLGGRPSLADGDPWYWYLAALIPTALLTGGNEEPGWRGFALPALLERVHPILAAVILGTVHALWHLPVIDHYGTTIGWYVLNVVPLTFILNWFFLVSRKAVIPVMLAHAGTNVIGGFFPTPTFMLPGGIGSHMVLRSIVYWGMAIALTVATRGRLGAGSLPREGDVRRPATEHA